MKVGLNSHCVFSFVCVLDLNTKLMEKNNCFVYNVFRKAISEFADAVHKETLLDILDIQVVVSVFRKY